MKINVLKLFNDEELTYSVYTEDDFEKVMQQGDLNKLLAMIDANMEASYSKGFDDGFTKCYDYDSNEVKWLPKGLWK